MGASLCRHNKQRAALIALSLSSLLLTVSALDNCAYASNITTPKALPCPIVHPLYTGDEGASDHTSTGVTNLGGSVLNRKPTPIFFAWYGQWDSAVVAAVNTFIKSLTPGLKNNEIPSAYTVGDWWRTLPSVYSGAGQYMKQHPYFVVFDDTYPIGKTPNTTDIEQYLESYVRKPELNGKRFNGYNYEIIVFMAAKEVQVFGMCDAFCSFHGEMISTLSKPYYDSTISYAVVSDPSTSCLDTCSIYGRAGSPSPPSGDTSVDATIANLAYELAEIVTNPSGLGWQDELGNGVAAKCNWRFGGVSYDLQSGGVYNAMGLHNSYYYLPQLWNQDLETCSSHFLPVKQTAVA